MFLKKSSTTINGKRYHHYKIVESYRDGNKVKHRIVFNIGTLTDEQAEQLRLALQVQSNPSLVVAKENDIVVTKSLSYLNVMMLYQLWQQWNLGQFFPEDRWVEALVINRCIDPTSQIQLQSWTANTILPAVIPALRTYDEYDVYRELDRLTKQEDDLQVFLYEQLKKRQRIHSEAFFYDITSSYVEGSRCVMAKLGYSRDHRPDREQIVIALMITPEGYPFYWRVLEGNTQDITTVEALVQDVRKRFGIERCTLVFDRGMVSADNLKAIGQQQLKYVSAMDKDEIRTTLLDKIMPDAATSEDWEQVVAMREFRPWDENEFLFYRPVVLSDRRYIVTFDVQRFLDQTKHRKRQMQNVEQSINQINESLRNARKSRKSEVVEQEVNQLLSRKGLKKQAKVTIEPLSLAVTTSKGNTRTVKSFQIQLEWLEDQIQNAARLDGLTCFITNMSMDEADDREVIELYRRKNKVEEAFHEIKSHLQLRPMHVTRTERVKAHVTVCMLANFLMNDMEVQLKAANHNCSPTDVLDDLQSCQLHRLEITTSKRKMLKVQEVSEQQKQWLQALHCEKVVQEKFKKQVLKNAESWL
ncbi:IS1634 family transposase [Effusibacillus dendaii]|uniref:Transposase n=1 Tax=Effusibacillus dendaii TaxID=2743772 RepID=A0A7I8DC88_9BACL|nr:IS1634 family transposase [Effusibacillus dendaii]BCJ87704.1 transposase [Effusibacillus dendaii]